MMSKVKKIVKKSNALINAAYRLTLAEQRLILLSIARAGGAVEEELTVHAREYATQFDVPMPVAYQSLRDATRSLFERRFRYQRLSPTGRTEYVVSRWVQHVVYGVDEGLVRLKFVTALIPLLSDLRERFTQYELDKISALTSVYAIRMYEILIAWRSTHKTPVIEIADLRRQLGVEETEYLRIESLKRRVIDFSINQINTHTDIDVSYEQIKRGRAITGFQFTFTTKRAAASTSASSPAAIDDRTPKRQVISKSEAERMARPGESYEDLYRRLAKDYIIR